MKIRTVIRLVPVLLLGIPAAVLVSCGSSGTGLIPAASAGPLQNDFEAVAQAAQTGNGSCVATESALGKTEQDFLALPLAVNKGLRSKLDQGIANLRKQALAMCAQPTPGSTLTTSTPTTTATTQTTTTTQTTPPTTTPSTPTSTPTTPTSTIPPGQGGGTAAPGEGSEEHGEGKEGGTHGVGKEGASGLGNENSGSGGASAGGGQ